MVEGWTCPTIEETLPVYDKRFHYAQTMEEVFRGLGVIALLLGLVGGASFVGAMVGLPPRPCALTGPAPAANPAPSARSRNPTRGACVFIGNMDESPRFGA